MKTLSYLIILLFCCGSCILAQNRGEDVKTVNLFQDFDGNLIYENNIGFKAKLSQDNFEYVVYNDNHRNEIIYSKTVWEKIKYSKTVLAGIFPDFVPTDCVIDDMTIFRRIIDETKNKNNYIKNYSSGANGEILITDNSGNRTTIGKDIFGNTEIKDNKGNRTSIEKDIFGNTQIKDNKGNRTSIGKDIFGNTEIKDNKGNRTSIEKDIFGNTHIKDNGGNDWYIKRNIFDDLEFYNHHRMMATLKKNIFNERVYKDSNNFEIKYSEDVWNKMINELGSDEKVFMALLYKYFWK